MDEEMSREWEEWCDAVDTARELERDKSEGGMTIDEFLRFVDESEEITEEGV